MSTLSERLKQEMARAGYTQAMLAEKTGMAQASIHKLTSGKALESRKISLIANALGVNTDWLATGKGEKSKITKIQSNAEWLGGFDLWDESTTLSDDEVALPFFREVELAAGAGRSEVIENHGAKLRFAKSTLKKQGVQSHHAACVTVSGNSMMPVLPDGATIGIDTSSTAIKNGDIYAINHDGHLRVKMVYRMPGDVIRLRSFNSDEWPDEFYSGNDAEKISIIGRVFWWSVLR